MERAHSSGGSGGHHSQPAHWAPPPPLSPPAHSRLEVELVVLGVTVRLDELVEFWLLLVLELVRAVWLAETPPPGPPYQAGR